MYSYTYWLATTEGSKLLPSTQSSLELHFLAQLSNFELLVDTQKKTSKYPPLHQANSKTSKGTATKVLLYLLFSNYQGPQTSSRNPILPLAPLFLA
jgi:hypothetical protein